MRVTIELTDRDLLALKWAPTFIRASEHPDDGISGIREGEAMSDVLAAIHHRIERALANPDTDRRNT